METPNDLDLLTRTILSEAGSQGPIGMQAAAEVIRNRTIKRGMTPGDVVLERNQFEPWNKPGNPNDPMKWDPASPRYKQAQEIAQAVFGGKLRDVTGGATHFANVGTVQQRNGGGVGNHGWINPKNMTAKIGAHTFFAPEGRVQGFNSEMMSPFWPDPIKSTGSNPIQPIGGMQQQGSSTPTVSPIGGGAPAPSPSPSMGGGNGGGSTQPPIFGRMLFGDGGLKGFMNSAVPTPFGGQGLLKGGFNAMTGGAPGAAGAGAGAAGSAPMALPGVGSSLAAAPAAATTAASAAAPAAATAAAPAAAGGASAIGSALASLFAML